MTSRDPLVTSVAWLARLASLTIAIGAAACSSFDPSQQPQDSQRAEGPEAFGQVAQAASGPFTWKGFTWTPTSGGMAGVAAGDPANVSVDANGYLHLKIVKNGNTWTAAEVFTTTSLGFGTYQWQIDGPIDRMDHTIVLGLYPYGPAAGIGGDGTNEIDTEFSFWNDELNGDNVDWGVYPATTAGKHWEKDFVFSLNGGSETTARMVWSKTGVKSTLLSGFQAIASTTNTIATYDYTPTTPAIDIPQQACPLGMNLWAYNKVPASGQPTEIIIRDFQFVPEGQTVPTPFVITANAGAGGTISPSGSVSVNAGDSQVFTIAADATHSIQSVTVDGVSQGAVATYKFDNVQAAHTIAADFGEGNGAPDASTDPGTDAGTPGSEGEGGGGGGDAGARVDSGSHAGGGSSASPDGGDGSTGEASGCAIRGAGHDDHAALAVSLIALGAIASLRRKRAKDSVAAAVSCIVVAAFGSGSGGCGSSDGDTIDGGGSDNHATADSGGGGGGSDGGSHASDGGGGKSGSDGSTSGDDDGGPPPSQGDDGGTATNDASPPASDGGISNILVPAQGALLGHFYGDGTLAVTDARIGRKPNIHLTYYSWNEDWTQNDVPSADLSQGRVPLVNWEPDNINFDDIISGKLDSTIQARAAGSKALGQKFFLDFAAEMNGDEAWGGNNPAKYIAAYRHIHDIFVTAGATNVVWAWCPNVTDVDGTNKATMSYYPGDAYVDWTGVDGYNWGTSDSNFTWQSFHDVFAGIYPLLAAKGKPILIGEMASDEVGGDKGKWIDEIVPTLKSDFPLIKAFVWFDIKKERQWQINSSPNALAAFARMAKDPFMNP